MYKITVRYKVRHDTRWHQATYKSITRSNAIEMMTEILRYDLEQLRIPGCFGLYRDRDWGGWALVSIENRKVSIEEFERIGNIKQWILDRSSQIEGFTVMA